MRICLLAYRLYDFNTHMMQFANALARRGDVVDVVSVGIEGAHEHDVVNGVHVWRIQRRHLEDQSRIRYLLRLFEFILRSAWFITRRHIRSPYQMIHVQSVPDFLVFAALVPRLLGTPVILDFRDLVPEFYASKFHTSTTSAIFKLLVLSETISCAFARHVLVANPIWHQRIVGRSAKPDKCTEFWYQPDPTVFHPRGRQRKDRAFRIMYPGNLNRHQGLDIAIAAFPKILQEAPDAELYIYGDGPAKQELADQIVSLHLQERVKILEIVPVAHIAEAMAESDLGIVPKRASSCFGNEQASTKIFEFMAIGVPVVASRTKIDECYFDDSLVRFFQSENEDDLAQAVLSVYRDQALRNRLIENGARFIAEGKWGAKISDYLRLVDSLTCRTTRRPYHYQESR